MVKISALALFLFALSAGAQNLAEAEQIFKNGSSEQIARQIFSISSKKVSHSELLRLFELLDDTSSLKKVGCNTEVRDAAVLILQEISHISASKRNRPVKAIISFKDDQEKVYRYHLFALNKREMSSFKLKIQSWLLKKIPA